MSSLGERKFFSILLYAPPTPLAVAVDQVEVWQEGRIAGPLVHDARIAAVCRLDEVRELWSADRNFSRFPGLPVRNPLVG